MIQDIYPHQFHNHYDPSVQANGEDTLFCIANGRILVEEIGFAQSKLKFPKWKELPEKYAVNSRYLFAIDESKYFLCDVLLEEKEIPNG